MRNLITCLFLFCLIALAACKNKEEKKEFFYNPDKAFYFKHPENDSTSQILSVLPRTIFREDSVIPVEIVFSWYNRICKLKELKGMKLRFIYTDQENKRIESPSALSNFLIYRDIPNRPDEIVRIPLQQNGEWLCSMFDSLGTTFSENEYLNFECTGFLKPASYPEKTEVELTLTWKDKEQVMKATLTKLGHTTYEVRSRPFG